MSFFHSQELGEKLKSKFSELAELRKRRLTTDEEGRDKDFLSKAHNLSQSLTDLSQQVWRQKLVPVD